jgi:hypothetical protein
MEQRRFILVIWKEPMYPMCSRARRTQDCLLKLPRVVDVEELAGTERKDHALIVFLQLVIDLCSDQSRKLSLGKRLILV